MKPVGLMMKEHRIIERMVALLETELRRIGVRQEADSIFIATAVDFFRTYADRTHHGKEEDILFKALTYKKLTPGLRRIMDELISEHVSARSTVAALSTAMSAYAGGNRDVLMDIIEHLKKLVELYPKHIEKEDRHFFLPAQDYFDKDEQETMLRDFDEFDRNMIHEKYAKVIENMKAQLG